MNVYEIRVQGRLDQHWTTWFAGLMLTYEGADTVLTGVLADEAALHGVLTKIAGLNLHLLSVIVVEPGVTASAAPATPDPSAGKGHEPSPLDALPSPPLADMPVPERKRKSRSPSKRPQKRSSS